MFRYLNVTFAKVGYAGIKGGVVHNFRNAVVNQCVSIFEQISMCWYVIKAFGH